MESKWRTVGLTIVLGASLGAAAALLAGQLDRTLAVGMAMVGILIGSALARGDFQRPQPPAAPSGQRPPTDDQRFFSGKE